MSDIIICGMKMPRCCNSCHTSMFCLAHKEVIPLNKWISSRPNWCPLVKLPEGHGRLVDADAFKKSIYRYFDSFRGTEFNDLVKGILFSTHILDNAPTVVPAESDVESDE